MAGVLSLLYCVTSAWCLTLSWLPSSLVQKPTPALSLSGDGRRRSAPSRSLRSRGLRAKDPSSTDSCLEGGDGTLMP